MYLINKVKKCVLVTCTGVKIVLTGKNYKRLNWAVFEIFTKIERSMLTPSSGPNETT